MGKTDKRECGASGWQQSKEKSRGQGIYSQTSVIDAKFDFFKGRMPA